MEVRLKIITMLLFAAWRYYWIITERRADREKPKTKAKPPFFAKIRMTWHGVWAIAFLLFFQLIFGIAILPLPTSLTIQLVGFALVIIGLGACVVARRELSSNWANAWEFQIKHNQELVTTGIYAFVRHPIYVGLVTAMIGAELVAESYLFLPFLFIFCLAYLQAKKEEKLLEGHFGKEYADYKKRTKMFIPFVF